MSRGHGLGAIRSVPSFRDIIDSQAGLTATQRMRLIKQAAVLIRDLYTHLPLKQAMHSIDPLQRLRLLEQRVAEPSITEFHAELLDIFKELRDLHTNYTLPAPFGNQIAFLGILVEQYFEGGRAKWMVSKVAKHLVSDPTLVRGVEITHWNGMPIEAAVGRNADKEAGSNLPARLARGLETLTLRFMRSSFPPDEDWVTVTYLHNGTLEETRLDWQVFDSGADLLANASDPDGLIQDLTVPLRYNVGVDERREYLRRAQKMLFNRAAIKEAQRVARYKGGVPRSTTKLAAANIVATSRPDEITAKIVDTASGRIGYLRLWTFHMEDGNIDAFINEFIRLLRDEMPHEGLILDVRGNGGGFIIAAEFLLQMLTPKHITPEPTQFVATSGTLDLVGKVASMAPWRPSLEQAVRTGALYSTGIALSPEDLVNSFGQIYFGPVVLVTDAYCYSACDMFAAGFQDHEIGLVLGVDEATGAGGANVLTHRDLASDWTGGPLEPLPAGAGMRVSLRRTLRVGKRAGEPVEDLGVTRDRAHEMTRNDLLNGNVDLLDRAGALLAQGTPRRFDWDLTAQGQALSISLTTQNIQSVDVYVDGRPAKASTAVSNGTTGLQISMPPSGALLQVDGFDGGELVASRKLTLP
ncbi:MAG: S41 family peptidase [Alphaproteobacteria bacterium]|nr:S41 family peptidase [Alphaproteobacteria bacterium]